MSAGRLIVVIGNYADSLIGFRGALMAECVARGHRVIACAPDRGDGVEAKLRDLGVGFELLPFARTGANPFGDLRFFLALRRLLRRHRPDTVLSYTVKPIVFGSFAAAAAGVRQICSIVTGLGYVFTGDSPRQRALRPFVGALYRRALALNATVFFMNGDDERLFRSLGILRDGSRDGAPRVVRIAGSGVDLQRFQPAPCANDRDRTRDRAGVTFLLIARLIADKGIREFVAAARILARRHPAARFQLLGPFDSNPNGLGRDLVREWVDSGAVEYLGETGDVRPFIAAADVYVLPSYREGTPRTVLEAMAMGLPIVTTDAPGCRETVVEGVNGYLVPVRDADALAAAMERFIVQPDLIPTLGRESRRIAEETFDVRKVNAVILEALG